MRDVLFGISLALIAFVTLTALFTPVSLSLWRLITRGSSQWSAKRIETFAFRLRLFPIILSAFCLFALFVPAFWLYEPPQADETLTIELAVLALLSSICFVYAIWRSLMSWRSTRRIIADWMHKAEAVSFESSSVSVYRIEHPYPLIAVVGLFRPKIFIANKVFGILSEDELAAAFAHEHSHVLTRDNLKRWIFNFCRDLMRFIPCRQLEQDWNKAIEFAADDKAAGQSGNGALDLASALVKLSRAIPKDAHPTLPAGAYINGDSSYAVQARVERLLRVASNETRHQNDAPLLDGIAVWSGIGSASFAFFLLITQTDFLYFVHHTIEQLIRVVA
jgi:Zn-dependent protease with chaperone function